MKNNPYSEMIKKYKETVGAEKAALTDQNLEKVAGGVGGANEATCPICGIPMRKTDSGFGDPFWVCDKCGTNQIVSDAEFIEIVRYMEQLGYPVDYPVWWKLIK